MQMGYWVVCSTGAAVRCAMQWGARECGWGRAGIIEERPWARVSGVLLRASTRYGGRGHMWTAVVESIMIGLVRRAMPLCDYMQVRRYQTGITEADIGTTARCGARRSGAARGWRPSVSALRRTSWSPQTPAMRRMSYAVRRTVGVQGWHHSGLYRHACHGWAHGGFSGQWHDAKAVSHMLGQLRLAGRNDARTGPHGL